MGTVRNILVIAPHYNTFVKGSVDATANNVSNITVLVHHNYFSELAPHLPFSCFRHIEKFSKENIANFKGKPENVAISIVSMLYFIPDGHNPRLSDKILKKFDEYLMNNKINIDLIHAHFTWPCGYVGVKLAKKYCVPIVITAHGFDVYELPFRNQVRFNQVKYVLDNASHIITVSEKMRDIISTELGICDNKVSIISNGFDSKLFRPMDKIKVRQNLSLPLDRKILINVGNLVSVKGLNYLIYSIKKIVKVRNDVLCFIVGDDILKKDLVNQIKKLNLENYIKLVGAKPHNEIPLWMNACDLFVLPSLNEGNPTVMFEALGCGKPFVGTKVGGIPEIIINDKLGVLVEPKDPEALAQAILRALETEWDSEYIHGYAEQFIWENIAEQIMQVYDLVMKRYVKCKVASDP